MIDNLMNIIIHFKGLEITKNQHKIIKRVKKVFLLEKDIDLKENKITLPLLWENYGKTSSYLSKIIKVQDIFTTNKVINIIKKADITVLNIWSKIKEDLSDKKHATIKIKTLKDNKV